MMRRERMRILGTLWAALSGLLLPSGGYAADTPDVSRAFREPMLVRLERAIEADDREQVSDALALGAGANARGARGVTPLMIAVGLEKRQAVLELLAHGADPNARADDGVSPVGLAVENYGGGPEILMEIMRAGGDPNARRPNRDPVIMRFVNDRNCDMIRRWRELGADLDVATRAGDPIITAAALRADWDVVWCLLELGARYDYEQSSRQPLSRSFLNPFPANDSPIWQFKLKAWAFLRDKGVALPPLPGQ